MYVLELRTYMLDADSKDELAPRSRISRWEDRNNDGVYETGTTFVDGLIFPRFVTPLGDGVILTKESNAGEVWMYTDTNKDGVADKRELFTTDFGRSANVEHQEAELTWLMDNWMYATRNAVRLRWTPKGAIREPIGNPGGSWGITQDDDGKMFSQGGASGVPGYFQFPVHYGEFAHPQELEQGAAHAVRRGGQDRGHAGRHGQRAHAGRFAERHDGRRRRRHLPRPSSAGRAARRLFLRRGRRAHRSPHGRHARTKG